MSSKMRLFFYLPKRLPTRLLVGSWFFFWVGFGFPFQGIDACKAQYLPSYDSVEMLISNNAVQLACTEAMNHLYNFDFRRSEDVFFYLKRRYPRHPLAYFLLGLSERWKIMPNIEETRYDAKFMAYMDSTILYGEALYDKYEDDEQHPQKAIEAAFFVAAGYAFKGWLNAERGNKTKAAFDAKKALKYHQLAAGNTDLTPELLFGDGLYNYYVEYVAENYPGIKPILWFFKSGEKEKGILQLEEVVREGFYAKTEAQYFLMTIYKNENQREKASLLAEYLHHTFPNNPYFHRYYAISLFQMGDYQKLRTVSLDILNRIDSSWFGYEATSGRYAAFYLGYIYKLYRDYAQAQHYLERAVTFGESNNAQQAGYYLYSLAYLAQIAHQQKNYQRAKLYYEKILDHAEKKHPTKEEAKKYLKENKKLFK